MSGVDKYYERLKGKYPGGAFSESAPRGGVAVSEPRFLSSPVVRSVAFSPEGGLLASGFDDNRVGVWEVSRLGAQGYAPMFLNGHPDGVRSVAFSPDGGLLASGSDDDSIGLWGVKRA
jgi:WD40 repeat protein